jgi:hypothetical protein
MPSKSKAQQRLMGMAYAVKSGEMDRSEASDEVLKLADTMTLKQLRDFASTKHESLPEIVDESSLTGFLSAGPFARYTSFADNFGTAWQSFTRDKSDNTVQSFMEFVFGKDKDKKTKIDESIVGALPGMTAPTNTPGMGNVAPPSAGNVGSGDRFDNGSDEDDDEHDYKDKVGIMSYENYKKWFKQWQKQQKHQA